MHIYTYTGILYQALKQGIEHLYMYVCVYWYSKTRHWNKAWSSFMYRNFRTSQMLLNFLVKGVGGWPVLVIARIVQCVWPRTKERGGQDMLRGQNEFHSEEEGGQSQVGCVQSWRGSHKDERLSLTEHLRCLMAYSLSHPDLFQSHLD